MIEDILGQLLTRLNLPFEKIEISESKEEGFTRVDIVSNQASKIIGWHGETLNSIQHMLKALVRSQAKLDRAPFLILDVDGYRRMQEEKVCKAAERKADFVRRTGNRVALQPMSPYFRRVVHLHVANHPDFQDLTTMSQGDGDYRQIVLKLKDESAPLEANESDEGELSPVMADEEDAGADAGLENLDI